MRETKIENRLVSIPIGRLIAHPGNPNRMSKRNFARLVRNIEKKGPKQAIVKGIRRTCVDLGIDIVAEGVETESEFRWLQDEGIKLFQGYLFARPAFEKLPESFYGPA